MGAGKTLSLTFLGLLNKYKHNKKIYANYDLGFSHYRINTLEQFALMNGGEQGAFACLDEIWRYCDSRRSSKNANLLIAMILGASRKRNVDIGWTAQTYKQTDIRLRSVKKTRLIFCFRRSDLWAIPYLNDNGICTLEIYDQDFRTIIDKKRFPAQAIFPLYNTREEINELVGLEEVNAKNLKKKKEIDML